MSYEQQPLIENDGITLVNYTSLPPEQTALFPSSASTEDIAALPLDTLQSMAADEQFTMDNIDFTAAEKRFLASWLDPIASVDPNMASELAEECLRIKRNGGNAGNMTAFIKNTLSSDIASAA